MKKFTQKLIGLFSLLAYLNIYAQCDIPEPFSGNTGSNMTVMLTPNIFTSFPTNLVEGAYVVAVADNSNIVVGSEPVFGVDQAALAVWGDDSSTPETDGAAANESITYYLVNGDELYDVDFTSWAMGNGSSYITSGINAGAIANITFNCDVSGNSGSCSDPNYLEYYYGGDEGCITLFSNGGISSEMFSQPANTGANMTVGVNTNMFIPFEGGQIGAFYDLNGDGTLECVGLEVITNCCPSNPDIFFFGLAIWGDDSSTPAKDGLDSGDVPQFAILYNGLVFAINEVPSFTGYVTNGIVNITDIEFMDPSGCTDPSACNYDQSASVDDGSCYNNDLGCGCDNPAAEEGYDCDGNCIDTDTDGICDFDEIPGCTDPIYVEFSPLATDDDESCELLVSDLVISYDSLDNAYQILLATPQCEEIVINIQEGWNIFGYTSSQIVEIGEVMAPYDDKIYIIKDNNGSQYWPANNYNGIGDFIPGGGYQIKAYDSFSISFEN